MALSIIRWLRGCLVGTWVFCVINWNLYRTQHLRQATKSWSPRPFLTSFFPLIGHVALFSGKNKNILLRCRLSHYHLSFYEISMFKIMRAAQTHATASAWFDWPVTVHVTQASTSVAVVLGSWQRQTRTSVHVPCMITLYDQDFCHSGW